MKQSPVPHNRQHLSILVEPCVNPTIFTDYIQIEANLLLLEEMSRKEYIPTGLKHLALSTIEERFPEDQLLRLYSDGLMNERDNTGVWIDSTIFSQFIPVSKTKQILLQKLKSFHTLY